MAFAGHMIDAPGRPVPRFPSAAEGFVAAALHRALDDLQPSAGVTALASGGDILFAKDLVDRHADLHVLLPVAVDEFVQASVRPAGESWVGRFHDLMRQAKSVEVFGDAYFEGSGTPFQLAALLIDGTAELLARKHGIEAVSLGVWDGRPGDGMGGAASFIGHAVEQGRRVIAIHPSTGEAFTPGPEAIVAAQRHSWGKTPLGDTVLEHRLCAFLFADVKGFGRLRETQVAQFVESIISLIATVTRAPGMQPLALNTWGDGLLVVSESPAEAAEIALRLIEGVPAQASGAGNFALRVGLHCGPAFFVPNDPITGRPNVYGADVNRAARIEPIVTPGEVWASQSFVTMAAATSVRGFSFDDLGEWELFKDGGKTRLSRVRRTQQSG